VGDRDKPARRVIVFIHGIFGDGTSTWTNPDNGAYFPALVKDDPAFAGVDIWVHDFPSPLLHRTYTVDELADHLRKYLNNDNVVSNHQELVFVCHSMGGLVARAYLLKYRNDVPPDRVRMLYFFSTPTTGSDLANLGSLISSNPQLADMRKLTTYDPHTLGIWESQWSSSPYAQRPISYCAYELLPTHGVLVVERESARALCNTRSDPIRRDHIAIVKPADNVTDESYTAFRDAYRETFERHPEYGAPMWNLSGTDHPLLRARNVSEADACFSSCWRDDLTIAPGDDIELEISYHNGGERTATNVQAHLTLPTIPTASERVVASIVAGGGAPVFGAVTFTSLAGPVLLTPSSAWLYSNDRGIKRSVPPAAVVTAGGINLPDVQEGEGAQHLVIELHCDGAPLLGFSLTAGLGERFSQLIAQARTSNVPRESLSSFMQLKGHLDREELGLRSRWISEVTDIDDDGALFMLSFFNADRDTTVDNLQLHLVVSDETAQGATLVASFLRPDGSSAMPPATATLSYRTGTQKRISLAGVARLSAHVDVASLEDLFDKALRPVAVTRDGVITAGPVPPQSAMLFLVGYDMVSPSEIVPFVDAPTTGNTQLNGGRAAVAALEIGARSVSRTWGRELQGLEPGQPVGLIFSYANTGKETARALHLNLAMTRTPTRFTWRGTIVATNAPPVAGDVTLTFGGKGGGDVTLYPDLATFYHGDDDTGRVVDIQKILEDGFDAGDLDPGETGYLVLRVSTAGSMLDPLPAGCSALLEGDRLEVDVPLEYVEAAGSDLAVQITLDRDDNDLTLRISTTTRAKLVNIRSRRFAARDVTLRYSGAAVLGGPTHSRSLDGRDVAGAGIHVGDLTPGDRRLLRVVYDVIRKD
jgi:pimeloyl-ACP methyl ester carboxylesterase